MVQADGLVLLTDIDGLYDRPPRQTGARHIDTVRSAADVAGIALGGRGSGIGRGGMLTKVQSALMASEAGIPVVLTRVDKVSEALLGETDGYGLPALGQAAFTAPDVAGACDNGPRCSEHRRGCGQGFARPAGVFAGRRSGVGVG